MFAPFRSLHRSIRLLLVFATLLVAVACRNQRSGDAAPGLAFRGPTGATQAPAPEVVEKTRMTAVKSLDRYQIGSPRVFDNLTLFAISSSTQIDVGPMTTLDAAMKSGRAEVREIGAEGEAEGLANAEVGTLVVENNGAVPIYVLAGTILKGGKQDRQVGQDFVVSAKTTTPVDAFCVEQGRWDGHREGQHTGGKFEAMKSLAVSKVRSAGQYEKDQSKVWSKVAEANHANGKAPSSGTLLATLDDAAVQKQQASLTGRVQQYLKGLAPQRDVVGFAYAVDGKIKSVRYFANHQIYGLYRDVLVSTAAVDAITARKGKAAKKPPALAAGDVRGFVKRIDEVRKAEKRATKADNVNYYLEAEEGYGSRTTVKPKGAASAAPVEISSDYLAK